jgi:hypothetical protein
MTRKCTVLLTLAIACLAPALAFAGPTGHGTTHRRATSATSSAEPLHVQVARAIFPRENWRRFLTQASAELTRQIAETGKGHIELAPSFADRLREQYEEMVPYEEMLGYQARLLDSQYSKAELRQLLVFYRTPLGRRSVPFLHDLMASSMQRAELKVQNELSGVLAQLRPLVRRLPPASEPGEVQPGQDPRAERDDATAGEDQGTGSGQPADDKTL